MSVHSFSYSQLVSLLNDYKSRLEDNGILTPFANLTDPQASKIAGEFLKRYVRSLCRYRRGTPSGDAYLEMLNDIGFNINALSRDECDELTAEHDDFYLRVFQFADHLLSPVESKLAWHEITAATDDAGEQLVLTIGEDYRIAKYHRDQKLGLTYHQDGVTMVPVPKLGNVQDIADFDKATRSFRDYVDALFLDVDSQAVREELKAQLLAVLTQKS